MIFANNIIRLTKTVAMTMLMTTFMSKTNAYEHNDSHSNSTIKKNIGAEIITYTILGAPYSN